MIKCELLVGGYSYDVTNDLMNWDDVEIKWKRDGYAGVVRGFSTKFEFCKGGYSLLVNEWLKNYLDASASIVVYVRNNSWLWDEKFRCALDFGTFTYTDVSCEINAIDDSLAALIKAKKGTQYEYSVDVVKEDVLLRYDRLDMSNRIDWMYAGDYGIELEGVKPVKGDNYIPIYITTSEIFNKNVVEVYDSAIGEGGAFVKALNPLKIHISTSLLLQFSFESKQAEYTVKLVKVSSAGAETILYEKECVHLTRVEIDMDVSLNRGDELRLLYNFDYTPSSHKYYGVDSDGIRVEFVARDSAVKIPVVTPVKLLNRLLKSMNGGHDGLTGTIASDARLDKTVLVAADSIRGLDGAKLYSSYNKFVEWMNAEFGFVPVIGEDRVDFVHRSSIFGDHVIKELGNVTDFELSVNTGSVHSRVNVGYDKVDYEGVNGKDEFRFTQQYTTGINLTDSSLELKSPYRADAYGIEFLAAKRGEDTTDDKSDNDVFMVGVTLEDGTYILDRSVSVEGVISPSTMFNGMYSQHEMIKSNAGYLASFANLLNYASSDGNSSVLIDGTSLNSDVEIGNELFTVSEMSVTTDDINIPTDLSGLVVFELHGKTYRGYVRELTVNIGRGESVTYDMIVKSVV